MPAANFNGARVLTLESRRGKEMSRLIETYGGEPLLAPAIREVPVPLNEELKEFGKRLVGGKLDMVIFLTGVGSRAMIGTLGEEHSTERLLEALRKVKVVARGPKPLAVQEYGVSNEELLEKLRKRGAQVFPVSVYQWELPEDLGPLRNAVEAVIAGQVDVALFTTGVQVTHLFRVAEEKGKRAELRAGLHRVVKASVGPSTTKVLESYGLKAEVEATHPKMGYLVREAAEHVASFMRNKQKNGPAVGEEE